MKNLVIKTSLSSLFAVGALISGSSLALAAETTANSDTSVNVVAPTTPGTHPPIVKPTDPDGDTGEAGNLTIDYASNFNYGTSELTGKDQTLSLTPGTNTDGEAYVQGIQVTDLRGTGTGWHVTAKLTELVGDTDQAHKLKGAELNLPVGELITEGETSTKEAPTSTQATLTPGGGEQPVLTAAAGKGMRTWFNKFDPTKETFFIPAGQYADNYQGKVIYTLKDTPA